MGKIHLSSGFVVLKNQRMMFLFMSHYKVKCGSPGVRCQGCVGEVGWKVGWRAQGAAKMGGKLTSKCYAHPKVQLLDV